MSTATSQDPPRRQLARAEAIRRLEARGGKLLELDSLEQSHPFLRPAPPPWGPGRKLAHMAMKYFRKARQLAQLGRVRNIRLGIDKCNFRCPFFQEYGVSAHASGLCIHPNSQGMPVVFGKDPPPECGMRGCVVLYAGPREAFKKDSGSE